MGAPVDLKTAAQVYQKQAAISNDQAMVTSSFGPCYAVVARDPSSRYTLLAHIDDTTSIQESVERAFQLLRERGVAMEGLEVSIYGGIHRCGDSIPYGEKLLKVLKQSGVENVDTKRMWQNRTYSGLCVDPKSGKIFLLSKSWKKLNNNSFQYMLSLFDGSLVKLAANTKDTPLNIRVIEST